MNHILKRKFHKKGYIINGVFAGTSLVEGTEVSGFSSVNNYILVPAIPANTTNFEIFLKVKFSNVATNQHFFNSSYTYSFLLSINTSGKLFTHISSNGTSWDIASNIQGVSTLSKDVWYYIKCSFNGSEYKIQLSSDNKIWTDEITISSTLTLGSTGGGRIGSGWYDTPGTYITCDFSQCYININGKRWWDGLKRCKYDYNFTTVGTPSISNPPSCEVSKFSTANYLVLDNSCKSINNAEYVFKFRTGSSFSSHQVIAHAEYFLSLEINTSGDVWGYNWGAATENKLFTAITNTDYWVKILINGTTKTYSYSTDGINYIGDVTFTDTGFDVNNTTYQFRLGLYSHTQGRPFLGSIDLTQSYIKINNQLWWSCFKKTENVVYKEDGNLSDYDFFDYKSYGLETTDYRKGYINNFFVVGAPSIANGSLVSGFSSANHLRLPDIVPLATADSWEKVVKFTYKTTGSNTQALITTSNDGGGSEETIGVSTKLFYRTSVTTGSELFKITGSTLLVDGNTYWGKIEFTGDTYNLYLSTTGKFNGEESLEGSYSSTIKCLSRKHYIGNTLISNYNYIATSFIDLKECYININGQRWWDGLKRCKYDYNFDVVGTPSISNAPNCEVSGFSASSYLKLPETFNPQTNTWEIVYKINRNADSGVYESILGNSKSDYSNGVHIFKGSSGKINLECCTSGASSWNICDMVGTTVTELNKDYWIKAEFTGSAYNLYISEDGVIYNLEASVNSTTSLGATLVQTIGISLNATASYFRGSIDLTQSYIKINNQLWWACFKQSDHLSFDEKGTDEDYDFINTKRHFLRHPTKRYYKIVPWEQPILTSNTSYGALTGGGYYTSSDRNYWHISDGKIPTTNDGADSWGTNNTAIGWVNWALEEEITIKGIKIYNRSHTNAVDYTLTGARFYTDSTKTIPVGEEFEILTSQGIYELTTIPEEGIKTNNIYFYKTGSTYSGLGELEITADKKVQSTYKDWDFYETIREVRKFYKNVSNYSHTATNGWSNVSNVFDGSADTYATCGTATDYIEIDFGKEVYIDSFVATGNWVDSVARAEDLRLYTVGDSDIETLVAQSSGSAATTTYTTSASFNRVKTSKIRFKLSETNYTGNPPTTQYPTRIREININAYCESDTSDYDFYKLEEEKNIVYNTKILKINPTPSYATVTINGEERNEIELMRNSSVSWSVSLDGYKTQSGTFRLSEDMIIDVVLESLYVPWEQPLLTSDTSHGTLTTNGYRDFWKPWYAFDGIIGGSNKYLGPVTGGEIVWQTPEAIKVNSCKIYTTEESSQLNRFPQKITIYASDDNVNWIEIGSLTGYEQPASGESVTVSCNSTKPYAYTKWVFSQGFGNVYYGIAVSEIEIDAEFLEEPSVPLYACYSDGETFIYVQTPLSTNSAFGWGIGYEQVSNSSEIEDVSAGPYDIVSVDDETLVYIDTDFGIEISCTRYYEGDLYE